MQVDPIDGSESYQENGRKKNLLSGIKFETID